MKIFIIHSNSDNKTINRYIKKILLSNKGIDILSLENIDDKNWEEVAKAKIKEADCGLFFVGKNSAESKNIDFELKEFIAANKPIYTSRLSKNNKYNEVLYRKTTFGNKEHLNKENYMYSEEIAIDDLVEELDAKVNHLDTLKLFSKTKEFETIDLIEQYKVYLKTSEDLIGRRQQVSNFYVTVNATLISILTGLIALLEVFGDQYYKISTIVCCFVISILGATMCFNWRRIILSYGRLNSAKMNVIQLIESHLPCNIYEAEWRAQTRNLGKKKYISFTNIEKTIPVAFFCIYAVLFVVGVVLLCMFLAKNTLMN